MCFVYLLVIVLVGCGAEKTPAVSGKDYYYPQNEPETAVEEPESSIKAEIDTEHYMIINNNMTKEYMVVRQLESGQQSMVSYSLTTGFFDKYGTSTSVSSFEAGQIITLGKKDSEGKLKSVQLAEGVWEYENVVRYEFDEERGVFEIADSKYYFDENLHVFSEGKKITLSDIQEDELRIVGMNKQILSVTVTTGHGVIALKNTELFEDSFIQIGREIFAEITGEMELEVAEGKYIVSVANKGYGGSKEYEVKRDEVTVIDLEELKGEGPKMCAIVFQIDTDDENPDAEITFRIDGEEVEHEEPMELAYGIHSIAAEAEGYETYSKKLYVNSETAVISVVLLADELRANELDTNESQQENSANQQNGNQENNSQGSSNQQNNSQENNSQQNSNQENNSQENNNQQNNNQENGNEEQADAGENTNHAGSLAGSLAGGTDTGTNAGDEIEIEEVEDNHAEEEALREALKEVLGGDTSADYLSTLSQLLGNVLN